MPVICRTPGGKNTSDATATPAEVLSGATFYNKTGKQTGIINRKAAATYTPSTVNQTIPAGQYLSGTQTISGSSNLTAGNIKKGITIFNVTGTHEGGGNFFSFPLSVQTSQPAPLATGHIWINTSHVSSGGKVYVDETVRATHENNSIIIMTFNRRNMKINVTQSFDTTRTLHYNVDNTDTPNPIDWVVMAAGNTLFTLSRPFVYTKVYDTLYLETAYMWSGSEWILLCQTGKYVISTKKMWYQNAAELTERSPVGNHIQGISKDGSYICASETGGGIGLYQRIGDTITKIYTFPVISIDGATEAPQSSVNTIKTVDNECSFSDDNRYVVVPYKGVYWTSPTTYEYPFKAIFSIEGSIVILKDRFSIANLQGYSGSNTRNITQSTTVMASDAAYIVIGINTAQNNNGSSTWSYAFAAYVYFYNEVTGRYGEGKLVITPSTETNYGRGGRGGIRKVCRDGYIYVARGRSGTNIESCAFWVDRATKTIVRAQDMNLCVEGNTSYVLSCSPAVARDHYLYVPPKTYLTKTLIYDNRSTTSYQLTDGKLFNLVANQAAGWMANGEAGYTLNLNPSLIYNKLMAAGEREDSFQTGITMMDFPQNAWDASNQYVLMRMTSANGSNNVYRVMLILQQTNYNEFAQVDCYVMEKYEEILGFTESHPLIM